MASKENNIDSSNKDNSNGNIDNNINNDCRNSEVIMKMIELEQDSKRFMIWNIIPGVR